MSTYSNQRMCLHLKNNNENQEITLNLPDVAIGNNLVIIDPVKADKGIIRLLKKNKIIKNVVSTINYNYLIVPLVKINMGKLKEYDSMGVYHYQEITSKSGGD